MQRIMHYRAHPGCSCSYVATRSFTDVSQLRVPQSRALNVPQLHNSRGKHSAMWHNGGVLSSTILLFKSWQYSSTTLSCDTAAFYSFCFSIRNTVMNSPGSFSARYLLEHFTPKRCFPSLRGRILVIVLIKLDKVPAQFVQHALDSNMDTSSSLGATSISLISSVLLRGYSREIA